MRPFYIIFGKTYFRDNRLYPWPLPIVQTVHRGASFPNIVSQRWWHGWVTYCFGWQVITPTSWWRHQMETFSASLAICAGNSPDPVNSTHKGQWRGALMFSLVCVWINGWVNNREAGDFRRHHAHYDVIVIYHNLNAGLFKPPLNLGIDEYLHRSVLRGCNYLSLCRCWLK